MTHDENVYPDPFTFKPERFFNADGKLNDDSRILAYGFGRRSAFLDLLLRRFLLHRFVVYYRICVGKAVASDMVSFSILSSITFGVNDP
jgi:hypothetical protein